LEGETLLTDGRSLERPLFVPISPRGGFSSTPEQRRGSAVGESVGSSSASSDAKRVTRAHARVGRLQKLPKQASRRSQIDRRTLSLALESAGHGRFSNRSTMVSKTVTGRKVCRGFESLPLRSDRRKTCSERNFGLPRSNPNQRGRRRRLGTPQTRPLLKMRAVWRSAGGAVPSGEASKSPAYVGKRKESRSGEERSPHRARKEFPCVIGGSLRTGTRSRPTGFRRSPAGFRPGPSPPVSSGRSTASHSTIGALPHVNLGTARGWRGGSRTVTRRCCFPFPRSTK
jgi:hypothetical protein